MYRIKDLGTLFKFWPIAKLEIHLFVLNIC